MFLVRLLSRAVVIGCGIGVTYLLALGYLDGTDRVLAIFNTYGEQTLESILVPVGTLIATADFYAWVAHTARQWRKSHREER